MKHTSIFIVAGALAAFASAQAAKPSGAARSARAGLSGPALTLLRISGHAGGVAVAESCGEVPSAPLGDATGLADALRQVSRAAKGYRVLEESGALDLLPPEGALDGLLLTPVPHFEFDGTRAEARGAIISIPAVAKALQRVGPETVVSQPIPSPTGPQAPIHVHLSNTTLLGVLNATALAEDGGVWFVRVRNCRGVRGAWMYFVSAGQQPTDRGPD